MAPGSLTRQKLVDYYLEACKPRAQWVVGMEVEKLGRDGATRRPIPYDGAQASVRRVLEEYLALRSGRRRRPQRGSTERSWLRSRIS